MSIIVWIVLAALIAGFAAGYGVQTLVSLRRRRRTRRSLFVRPASHRLQLESDHSHLSIVPGDDAAGDHHSSPRQSNRSGTLAIELSRFPASQRSQDSGLR